MKASKRDGKMIHHIFHKLHYNRNKITSSPTAWRYDYLLAFCNYIFGQNYQEDHIMPLHLLVFKPASRADPKPFVAALEKDQPKTNRILNAITTLLVRNHKTIATVVKIFTGYINQLRRNLT